MVLVAITLVRPWGDGVPAGTPETRIPATHATVDEAAGRMGLFGRVPPEVLPAATARPALARDQIACTSGETRLVSLSRLGSWTVRTWMPAEPVVASDPLDPAVQPVALDSGAVLALGFCTGVVSDAGIGAGGTAGFAAGTEVVRAWTIVGAAASSLTIEPLGSGLPEPGVAVLYRPADRSAASPAWAPGRYVLCLGPRLVPVDGADPAVPGRAQRGAGTSRCVGVSVPGEH